MKRNLIYMNGYFYVRLGERIWRFNDVRPALEFIFIVTASERKSSV